MCLSKAVQMLIAHQIKILGCDLLLNDLDNGIVKYCEVCIGSRRFGAAYARYPGFHGDETVLAALESILVMPSYYITVASSI